MTLQASRRDARLSASWPADRVHRVVRNVRERVREGIASYRRRIAEAIPYAELLGLSHAELERRGIARGDLHRLVCEMRRT